MSKVHVVTDSASTITPEIAQRLNITVVPLKVRIDPHAGLLDRLRSPQTKTSKIYQDGAELDHEELLLQMGSERVHPTVIGPTASDFRRVYKKLSQRTDQIISLHSSASLSPVCLEAHKAAREFMGRCDIAVMNSETLSLGLSILVREATELAAQSLPLPDIMREIRGIVRRIYIVLVTDTMDYLEHSGLISPTQAILGSMLGIRPFLAMEEGQIIPMEKVRGQDKAIDKLADFADEFTYIEQIAILQSTSYPTDKTKMLKDQLESIAPNLKDLPTLLYGPLLASHIGPDGTGLVVFEGKEPKLAF
ncbi:MAG TPA: DegV family protein [Chloroflexi bacterium]|nr:DegV family protein [Chloroflexota bacterium]